MDCAEASVSAGDTILSNALPRRRSRRAVLLTWLRKIHLYVGLWGAILGLLFGVTGILLNHRAIMKIPVEKTVQRSVQLALPEQKPTTPEELSAWLQKELKFAPEQVVQIKKQSAKAVVWADHEVMQPERWSISLQMPQRGVMAEYFAGNRFVKLDHTDATPIGTLTRLHMSVGVNAFWVLLSDTIAGSLILLSITGLLLWTQLRALQTAAVATSIGALVAASWFVWSM
ncbi:MAG: PepSY-associated TM helix domain-containing protein [Dechloromonas sp.]|uniref:PepSY-associated TM helix domain-containing protein n=1 Tax=Dechloromonas sp. TaxID=1917218 RepID=UPI0027FB5491|nr:PepSY-associated TM helix domain-containing protein [Dechloromonas sp.]MBT9520434.1 PepSY-associated TM helix domain-containing protein [Dechloromonas sp.]